MYYILQNKPSTLVSAFPMKSTLTDESPTLQIEVLLLFLLHASGLLRLPYIEREREDFFASHRPVNKRNGCLSSAYSIAEFSAERCAAFIPYFACVDLTPRLRFAKRNIILDLFEFFVEKECRAWDLKRGPPDHHASA